VVLLPLLLPLLLRLLGFLFALLPFLLDVTNTHSVSFSFFLLSSSLSSSAPVSAIFPCADCAGGIA